MFHFYCKVAGNDYRCSKEVRQMDVNKAIFIIDRMKKLNYYKIKKNYKS